jgi:hypothetical protein
MGDDAQLTVISHASLQRERGRYRLDRSLEQVADGAVAII